MQDTKTNRTIITVPNQWILEEVRSVLLRGKNVMLPVKGASMYPFLKEGDRVLLEPYVGNELTKGSIVLAVLEDRMILHRIIRINVNNVWLAGDANLYQRECVHWKNILGIAIQISQDGRTIKLNTFYSRFVGLIWHKARMLRRIAKKIF